MSTFSWTILDESRVCLGSCVLQDASLSFDVEEEDVTDLAGSTVRYKEADLGVGGGEHMAFGGGDQIWFQIRAATPPLWSSEA